MNSALLPLFPAKQTLEIIKRVKKIVGGEGISCSASDGYNDNKIRWCYFKMKYWLVRGECILYSCDISWHATREATNKKYNMIGRNAVDMEEILLYGSDNHA